jgi:hypothetical protein
MNLDVFSYEKVKPNQGLIDEIWNFDVSTLESVEDTRLSKYTIALGQWLIYYKSQTNIVRSELNKKQSDLEFVLSGVIGPAEVKLHGTKTAAVTYLLQTDAVISKMNDEITKLKTDLVRTDGVDKAVSELIAAFKRELSRRENELYTIRKEKYGIRP